MLAWSDYNYYLGLEYTTKIKKELNEIFNKIPVATGKEPIKYNNDNTNKTTGGESKIQHESGLD